MTTVLSQLTDRVQAVVQAAVPTGTGVFVDRADAESRAEAPAINIVTHSDTTTPYSDNTDRHEVVLELRLYVRAEPGTPAAEALHAAINPALMADAQLLALVDGWRCLGGAFDLQEADITAQTKVVQYRAVYLTNNKQY